MRQRRKYQQLSHSQKKTHLYIEKEHMIVSR